MDENATFEARAVLARRRARTSRLVLVVPLVALVAVVWAGVSGPRPQPLTADGPAATAVAATALFATPRPQPPQRVLGIAVHRLADLAPRNYGKDEVLAISGWYVPTAVTNCPALPAIYRDGQLPNFRGDKDTLVFCVRSGVLYAAHPGMDAGYQDGDPEISAVDATVVVGVIMPIDLEVTGTGATEVVMLGRFVAPGDACDVGGACRPTLMVDYLGWTPETPAT